MAASGGPKIEDVEGWRLALLLLGFATLTVFLEWVTERLESLFRRRKGLSSALGHVKNELLYVGTISLLLSAFQDYLARICIPRDTSDAYPSGYRRRGRQLLRSLLAGGGAGEQCTGSTQSLWPVSLQHDTHIFIFIVACTHIVYGTITVYLTLWKVRKWKAWEEAAQDQARQGDLKVMKMPADFLYWNTGSNPLFHWALMLARSGAVSVSQPMYHNARLMFVEKMGLPFDFDFHSLVVVSLEDELSRTLRPEWHLWLVAVVWFSIPPPSYVSFWMYGICLALLTLIGGKLLDILVQIAVQVAIKYGDSVLFGRMESNPRAPSALRALGRASLGRTSLGRPSLRALALRNPTLQRRFLEACGGDGGAAADGAAGGGGDDGDGGAGGVLARISGGLARISGGLRLGTAHSRARGGGGGGGSGFGSGGMESLPSREAALQLLRSWASGQTLASAPSGASEGAVGRGGGDGAAAWRRPVLSASTSTQRGGAAAASPAAAGLGYDGRARWATEAGPDTLERGSAPAAALAFRRHRFATIGADAAGSHATGGGGGGGGAAAAHAAAVPRHLGTIAEGSGGGGGESITPTVTPAKPAPAALPGEHSAEPQPPHYRNHQNNHDHHDRHYDHNHAQPQRGAAEERPERPSAQGGGGPGGASRQSVFEAFQRSPDHSHHAFSLRTAFQGLLPFTHHAHPSHPQPHHPHPSHAAPQPQPQHHGPRAAHPSSSGSHPQPQPRAHGRSGRSGNGHGSVAVWLRGPLRAGPALSSSAAVAGDEHGAAPPRDRRSSCTEIEAAEEAARAAAAHAADGGGTSAVQAETGGQALESAAVRLEVDGSEGATALCEPVATGTLTEGGGGGAADEDAAVSRSGDGRCAVFPAAVTTADAPAGPPLPSEEHAPALAAAFSGGFKGAAAGDSGCDGDGGEQGGAGAHAYGGPGDAGAGAGAGGVGRLGQQKRDEPVFERTGSAPRRVPLLLRPCYCGAKYTVSKAQYVRDLLRRREARGVHTLDAAQFFWFGRPRFMTSLFTIAYFQNSLSIAICVFSLAGSYQSTSTWQGVPLWAVLLQLAIDLTLVPQVALGVLPVYALIQPLGSHCPYSVIRSAIKAGLYPKQTQLISRALNLRLEAVTKQGGSRRASASAQHAHGGGGGGGVLGRLRAALLSPLSPRGPNGSSSSPPQPQQPHPPEAAASPTAATAGPTPRGSRAWQRRSAPWGAESPRASGGGGGGPVGGGGGGGSFARRGSSAADVLRTPTQRVMSGVQCDSSVRCLADWLPLWPGGVGRPRQQRGFVCLWVPYALASTAAYRSALCRVARKLSGQAWLRSYAAPRCLRSPGSTRLIRSVPLPPPTCPAPRSASMCSVEAGGTGPAPSSARANAPPTPGGPAAPPPAPPASSSPTAASASAAAPPPPPDGGGAVSGGAASPPRPAAAPRPPRLVLAPSALSIGLESSGSPSSGGSLLDIPRPGGDGGRGGGGSSHGGGGLRSMGSSTMRVLMNAMYRRARAVTSSRQGQAGPPQAASNAPGPSPPSGSGHAQQQGGAGGSSAGSGGGAQAVQGVQLQRRQEEQAAAAEGRAGELPPV